MLSMPLDSGPDTTEDVRSGGCEGVKCTRSQQTSASEKFVTCDRGASSGGSVGRAGSWAEAGHRAAVARRPDPLDKAPPGALLSGVARRGCVAGEHASAADADALLAQELCAVPSALCEVLQAVVALAPIAVKQ